MERLLHLYAGCGRGSKEVCSQRKIHCTLATGEGGLHVHAPGMILQELTALCNVLSLVVIAGR